MANKLFMYGARGVYFCHTTLAQIDYSLSEVQDCIEKFATPVESKHKNYFQWELKKTQVLGIDDLVPMLVSGHERNHYQQLMSTPCGLLLWRIYNSITSGIHYITTKLTDSSTKATYYLPLTEWFDNIGYAEIKKSPIPMPSVIIEKLFSSNDYDQIEANEIFTHYIVNIFDEVKYLIQFLQALQGHSSMTMREFVSLANIAFQKLSIRSDLALNIEWTAHNLDATSYLPNSRFSLDEIVEAGARFWELELLQGLKVSKDILQQWKERSIFGIYQPAFTWLSDELYDPTLARIAIDVALTTPIDLSCSEAVSGKIYVEDVLPSWRLHKIVKSLQNSFWSSDRATQEKESRHGIAARANIPTPEKTIAAALNQPFSGSRAWGADAKFNNIPDELALTQFYSYTELEVKRAFQIRYLDNLEFIHPSTPEIFQPILEFYKDKALFHCSPVSECDLEMYLKSYKSLVMNLALIALISDGDISEILHLQHSFSNRLALEGDIDEFKELWDAKSILMQNLHPHIYKLLHW